MKNAFDRLYDYIYMVITEGKIKNKKFTPSDYPIFTQLLNTFVHLIRYENDKIIIDDQQINDVFINNKILVDTWHVGTKNYDMLLNKIPALKKLNDNQDYIINKGHDNMLFDDINMYHKENNIVYLYDCSKQIKTISTQKTLSALPLYLFNKIAKFSHQKGRKKIHIPLEISKQLFPWIEEQAVDIVDIGQHEAYILSSNYTEKNNFFNTERSFRLFTKDGEVKDYDKIDYKSLLKDIRNAIAHNYVKKYFTTYKETLILVQLNDKTIVMDEVWYHTLLGIRPNTKTKIYSFVNIPLFNEQIDNDKKLMNILNNSTYIQIVFDEKGTDETSFDTLIKELTLSYKKSNAKTSLKEFLNKQLQKYYNNFNIIEKPLIINNTIISRIKNDLYNYTIPMTQFFILDLILNTFYLKQLNAQKSYLYLDNVGQITNIFIMEAISLILHKNKIYPKLGVQLENCITLCQLTIFYKLINNSLSDQIKKINTDEKIEPSYYKTKEGILRKELEQLDFSSFIITNTLKKEKHSVKSLREKILVIRLLRNSISHDSFKYYPNTTNFINTKIELSNITTDNIIIETTLKEILDFLQNNFFNRRANIMDLDSGNVKMYTNEDIEKIAINKCKK